jgi:hypothetical protein
MTVSFEKLQQIGYNSEKKISFPWVLVSVGFFFRNKESFALINNQFWWTNAKPKIFNYILEAIYAKSIRVWLLWQSIKCFAAIAQIDLPGVVCGIERERRKKPVFPLSVDWNKIILCIGVRPEDEVRINGKVNIFCKETITLVHWVHDSFSEEMVTITACG